MVVVVVVVVLVVVVVVVLVVVVVGGGGAGGGGGGGGRWWSVVLVVVGCGGAGACPCIRPGPKRRTRTLWRVGVSSGTPVQEGENSHNYWVVVVVCVCVCVLRAFCFVDLFLSSVFPCRQYYRFPSNHALVVNFGCPGLNHHHHHHVFFPALPWAGLDLFFLLPYTYSGERTVRYL